MKTAVINSPLGFIEIKGNIDGISSLIFIKSGQVSVQIPPVLQKVVTQLQQYFDGDRKVFTIKLAPSGTDFQKKIWNLLQNVQFGKSMSYLRLSQSYGDPKAIRAAASANGKNPILILIPCHRIISKDGGLGGFSAELWRKQWLLNHEQNCQQKSLF